MEFIKRRNFKECTKNKEKAILLEITKLSKKRLRTYKNNQMGL